MMSSALLTGGTPEARGQGNGTGHPELVGKLGHIRILEYTATAQPHSSQYFFSCYKSNK